MHVELIERLHRRFRLTFDVAESGEIMPTDEALRRRLHGRDIERLGDAPSTAAFEGEISAAVDDAIEVMAPGGGEAGIKRILHPFGCDHGNRMRAQMCVQGVAHCVFIPVLGKIHMADLGERVHAGVGAPRPLHAYPLSAECLDRGRQHALHRGTVILDLPAHERPAVIFDGELVARHGGAQPKRVPAATLVPRRNSCAFIAWRPARCSSRMRTAPSPQATVSSSSSTVPGAPAPSPLVVRRALTRTPSPAISNQAPGTGDKPRMWLCTCCHGRSQAIRVSSLFFWGAWGPPACGCGVSVSVPRSSAPSARTMRSAPRRASRSCKSPAVASKVIGTRSAIAIGPVSSPSSIFITITPVSASPAMIARWI